MIVARVSSTTPTRERLLRAAIDLFQAQGYAATGVSEILARAGAPKGSLYHHFPEGKEQLAIAAVQSIGADMVAFVLERRAQSMGAADVVRDLARVIARWLARSKWRQGTLLSALAQEAVPGAPALHRVLSAAFDAWRGALARAIREDGARARDAVELADLAIASIGGAIVLARVDRNAEPLNMSAERVARAIERAIRPK